MKFYVIFHHGQSDIHSNLTILHNYKFDFAGGNQSAVLLSNQTTKEEDKQERMELELVPFDLHMQLPPAGAIEWLVLWAGLCPVCLSPDGTRPVTGCRENGAKVSAK
jgi:hypothetical protein